MEKKIARNLLEIEAIFLKPNNPFTWSSGIKSPIYCDNRLTLSFPEVRREIAKGLATIIKEHYKDCEIVMGTSTAGIPHAAFVAEELSLPMGYVRGSSKSHGRQNAIEGKYSEGQKAVVIEDLISTGGSCIDVVTTLREAKVEVLGVASIFTYGLEKGKTNFTNANVQNYSLSNYSALLEVANELDYISKEDIPKLERFISNPSDESWML